VGARADDTAASAARSRTGTRGRRGRSAGWPQLCDRFRMDICESYLAAGRHHQTSCGHDGSSAGHSRGVSQRLHRTARRRSRTPGTSLLGWRAGADHGPRHATTEQRSTRRRRGASTSPR